MPSIGFDASDSELVESDCSFVASKINLAVVAQDGIDSPTDSLTMTPLGDECNAVVLNSIAASEHSHIPRASEDSYSGCSSGSS